MGDSYWLAGSTTQGGWLYLVNTVGGILQVHTMGVGVRPVVSLQSGVKVNDTNVGDGTSESKAYTLTK